MKKQVLAIAGFLTVLSAIPCASAENTRVSALRDQVQGIDARTTALRRRVERSTPAVRRAAERIVAQIETHRMSLATRLAIFDLLGGINDLDDRPLDEMEASVREADRLLSMVERWYQPPR